MEVARQSDFAGIAFTDLVQALNQGQFDRVWYSIQGLLGAAGNISKLFWPVQKYELRGRQLRNALEINDDSPLQPRTFRNHFEHFDERLTDWATSPTRGAFVDSNIGPSNMIGGIDPASFMRNFDTSRFAVTYRGDTYELKPIMLEIRTIGDRAKVEVDKSFRTQ